MYTLHHAWRSSASRRVRLCLAEKALAFESRTVDLTKMEHHAPEFLKLNPNGVIALLILEDGRSLYESGTTCEYLDETWPEPSLRPSDAYGRAVMRNWIRHVDGLISNLIIFNWAHGMAQVAQQWSDAELAEKLANVPSKERREAWLRTARRPYTEEKRGEARAKLVGLLDRMEETLRRTAWLAGNAYSIRHQRRTVREAHRGRDRAGRDDCSAPSEGRRVVDGHPDAAGVRGGEDRAVHGVVASSLRSPLTSARPLPSTKSKRTPTLPAR